jgi:hypothetical protein
MKSSLVLISAIAAATAGFGVSVSALASPSDAQAQAAALLNPTHESAAASSSSTSAGLDAQARAAALLSGVRVDQEISTQATTESTVSRTSGDAQAQAAALLSSSRSAPAEVARTTATREKLGVHPAVAVAQEWKNRGIDPNSFIVAHPARLQLVTSSSEDGVQLAQAKEAESVTTAGVRSGLSN